MKKRFVKQVCFVLSMLFSYVGYSKNYDIKALGADVTGKIKCTKLINETINLAANDGGGTLYFSSGTYLTGAITLKSNITIYLEAGATLKFSSDFNDYVPFQNVRYEGIFMNTFAPLLNAYKAENISIKGEGTLDGNGFAWWDEIKKISAEVKEKGKIENPNDLQQL